MSGKVGQPKAELTKGLAAVVTRNSCPALCWPIRIRSQSPICCSYQSSNRRVVAVASIPLIVFKLSILAAVSPLPWI